MEDGSSARPAPTEESSLLSLLKEQIQRDGPITFASFMQQSLYHPRFGYYANQVPGHDVHYATSPSITPRFGRRAAQAEWATEPDELPPVVGCVLANEVLDNFPVHVLQKAGEEQLLEVYVTLEGDQLVEQLGLLSNAALAEPTQQAAVYLGEGDRCEVCLGLPEWCLQAVQLPPWSGVTYS